MRFVSHAKASHLDTILDSDSVDVVSPFISSHTISRISTNRHTSFRLITRLPVIYNYPPAFLENDPRPILDAMQRMGQKLKIYALPPVHSKIYINGVSSWTGSANFTANGFSGKPELLIDFDRINNDLTKIFSKYLRESKQVTKGDIEKLLKWIDDGLTEVGPRGSSNSTPDEPEAAGANFDDFICWLRLYKGIHKKDAALLLDRAEGGNNMSGHVPMAFNGVASFLRKNSDLNAELLSNKSGHPNSEVMKRIANFVKTHGDSYLGPKGGKWRNYLSSEYGGRQTSGGAGNVIVRRTLVLLPAYLDHRGLL